VMACASGVQTDGTVRCRSSSSQASSASSASPIASMPGPYCVRPSPRGRLADVTDQRSEADQQHAAAYEELVTEWLTLPDVAERMGLPITRARQLVSDRQILAVRRGESGVLMVPAEFVQDGRVLKGLPGTLTLLADAKFSDEEAVRWLYTDDDLPGSPVQALVENRGTEVKRRAQALGF
jgi:hypothetical protein